MNKKLIAAAVAAAMLAPAMAMADVTVYGRAHVSIDSLDDGTDSGLNVSSNASRIGFKGSEDLGGGLKAGFQVESQVNLDNVGSGAWNGRNSFASLSGGFGEIRVGNHDTPLKDVRSKNDLFGDQIGDLRNLTRDGSVDGTGTNMWDERYRNGILYISPKLGVATIKLHYSTNYANGVASGPTANDNDALTLGVNFKAGPVDVMLAHETHNFTSGDESAFRVGLKGKFGPADVRVVYHSATDQGATSGADRDVMSVGAGFKFGKNTFKLQYAMADDFGSTANSGAELIAVGIDHSLSKSTKVYVNYASVDNDANAAFRVDSGGGHGDTVGVAANGQDPSAISIGMIHNF